MYSNLAVNKENRPKTQGSTCYCTDLNVRVITDNCKKRGWVQVSPEDKWNVYFALTKQCKMFFKRGCNYIMNNNQLISHFPNSYVLTRKDFLPKSVNKYIRELERMLTDCGESKKLAPKIIPTTYVLPQDYPAFIAECEKCPNTTWIMKPCCRSMGIGIFLTNDMKEFKKWERKSSNCVLNREASNNSYVASKYISRPLLIGGRKFDLRLYILVTSYQPLKAYLFKHGFCRFCTAKYDEHASTLGNHYIHLTNVSIQRHNTAYNRNHGGKWSIQNLKLYLEGTRGSALTTKLFEEIKEVIVHSLKAVQPTISSDLHCFEMYGYDMLIDCFFKPWLIEVNSSPSIYSTTRSDRIVKTKLFDSILSVIVPPSGVPDILWNKCPSSEAAEEFELLINEDQNKVAMPKNMNSYQELSSLTLSIRRAISSRRSSLKQKTDLSQTPLLSRTTSQISRSTNNTQLSLTSTQTLPSGCRAPATLNSLPSSNANSKTKLFLQHSRRIGNILSGKQLGPKQSRSLSSDASRRSKCGSKCGSKKSVKTTKSCEDTSGDSFATATSTEHKYKTRNLHKINLNFGTSGMVNKIEGEPRRKNHKNRKYF